METLIGNIFGLIFFSFITIRVVIDIYHFMTYIFKFFEKIANNSIEHTKE